MRGGRKGRGQQPAAGFFVTVVAIAQHIYCRRRIVELGDFSEEEAEIRFRKQMLRNMISTLYARDRATGAGARTAAESRAEMAEENSNNYKDNDDGSSTQTGEDRKKKRYRSDDSVACMLGEKLDNFTAVFQADVSEPPPKPASPEEILATLNTISDLGEDDLLAAYDILVSDDRKFKSLQALPVGMKRKWIMKQIKT